MSDIQITVSKADYSDLLDRLQEKVSKIENILSDVESHESRLKAVAQGPIVDAFLLAVDSEEKNITTAKEKIEEQIEVIQEHMDNVTEVQVKIISDADNVKVEVDQVWS